VFEDGLGLLADDAGEPGEELVQRGSGFEVLEERRDGHPGAAEHPGAAHSIGVALYRRALGPVQHLLSLARIRGGLDLQGLPAGW
jgi:hypothetical protein